MTGPPLPQLQPGSNAIGKFQIGISPIGDIFPLNFWSTVISQYANSPIITQLINFWDQCIDQTQNIDTFFEFIFSIDTAFGYGLDVWGRRLGVSRVITLPPGVFFGFEQQSPTVQGFNQAPFFSGTPLNNNFSLSDAAYRKLLIAKALANVTNGTIPALNLILLTLFPGQGNCFVAESSKSTNLITQSNGFSSWTLTNITAVPNSGPSPDGTNDAWILRRTSGAASFLEHDTNINLMPNVPFTFSVSAKAGTGNFLAMYLSNMAGDPTAVRACFNLSTGTVSIPAHTLSPSTNISSLAASIVPDAVGFFKCSVTAAFAALTLLRPVFSPRSTSGEIDGTDPSSTANIEAFGAQVEQNNAPSPYVATVASAPVSASNGAPMSITYTFNFTLAPTDASIVTSSGVLPRPAGVLVNFVQN